MDPSRPATPRRARALRMAAVAMVAVLALTGCGLRWETGPVPVPSPDAAELARARAVADAVAVAGSAQPAEPGAPPDVAQLLAVVTDTAARHEDELGGVWSPPTSSDPATAGSAWPVPTAGTPAAALDVLAVAAQHACADADTVPDGRLARLLAAVCASRTDLADRLAGMLGAPAPTPPAAAATDPTPTGAPADPSTAGAVPATATSPAPQGTGAPPDLAPGATGSATGTGALADLVRAEDEAGYGLEVVAARLSGEQRATARSAAAAHRTAAEQLAAAGGIDAGPADPRRVAYALPAGLDDPAVLVTLARDLETALAQACAQAVADTPAGARRPLVAGLVAATRAAGGWGAAPLAFPGLPEQVGAPA